MYRIDAVESACEAVHYHALVFFIISTFRDSEQQ